MREILFRGKREEDGGWIYGLYSDDYVYDTDFPCIVPLRSGAIYDSWAVIRDTVGQYTGLTDKNGTKIFEGDVVELTDVNNDIKWNAIVVFGNPYGEYCWGWNLMYVGVNPKVNTDILCWVDMEDSGAFIKVIGNIYDNPELLKGE